MVGLRRQAITAASGGSRQAVAAALARSDRCGVWVVGSRDATTVGYGDVVPHTWASCARRSTACWYRAVHALQPRRGQLAVLSVVTNVDPARRSAASLRSRLRLAHQHCQARQESRVEPRARVA